MKLLSAVVGLLFAGTASAAVTQKLEMRLVPSPADPSAHVIDVVTTIATDTKLPSQLELNISRPPGFMGLTKPNLEGSMQITTPASMDATDDGPALESTPYPENWLWIVNPGEAKSVRLRYRVPLTFQKLVPDKMRGDEMVPYVAADHAMLGTLMTTATATNAKPDRVLVRIITPMGLELQSPWPIAMDLIKGDEIWYDAPPSAIGGTEFLPLGTWNGPKFAIGGLSVRMLFPPDAASLDQRLREPLQRIVDYAVRLFGTELKDTFIFAFRFNEPGSGVTSATVGTNTIHFVLDPTLVEADPEPIIHTIAHEFVHLWGRRTLAIGSVSDMRWLHEGFTDYYASQICSRLGLMPRASFEKAISLRIETGRSTPARGRWSLTAAGPKGMQGDTPSNTLTYQGGWLLAAWLDAAIRRESLAKNSSHDFAPAAGDVAKPGTLDAFMRDFYNDSQWNDRVRPTPAHFAARLAKYLPQEQIAKFQQFTNEPWAFDAEAEFTAVGVTVARKQAPAERMGVFLTPGSLVIQEVPAGSPGATLGLQAGDEILRVNGVPITASKDLRPAWQKSGGGDTELVVRRGSEEMTHRGKKPLAEVVLIDPSLLLR